MGTSELYDLYLKYPTISTDTRKVEKNSIFFALKGENFDGNKFAKSSIEKGSAYAVVDDPDLKGEKLIHVENVLGTLQALAKCHRENFKIPVICITGTNGKTTTRELITAVLEDKYNVRSTKGNFNNHIGVPLSLLTITDKTEIAIIELGANHIGEIDMLSKIALPTHGIITNIGKAHLEGFKSIENIIKTKLELFDFLRAKGGTVLVNADDDVLHKASKGMKNVTYGLMEQNNPQVLGKIVDDTMLVKIKWRYLTNKWISLNSRIFGSYNAENLLAAIAVGKTFNVRDEHINNLLQAYEPRNSRSQVLKTDKNEIILDAYNANPTSMMKAINSFCKMSGSAKVLVLGDMYELGKQAEEEHRILLKRIESESFYTVILAGPIFCKVATNSIFHVFAGIQEAKLWIEKQGFKNTQVLIKGSRGMKMEDLAEAFS